MAFLEKFKTRFRINVFQKMFSCTDVQYFANEKVGVNDCAKKSEKLQILKECGMRDS